MYRYAQKALYGTKCVKFAGCMILNDNENNKILLGKQFLIG